MANSNPSILIAASTYPPDPGGPSLHAYKQFEALNENGYRVTLVALAHFRKYPPFLRHFLFFLKLLSSVQGMDVVYAHDPWGAGFPAMLTARVTRKKFVLRIGGDLAWERKAESKKTNLSLKEWYKEEKHKNNFFYNTTKITLKNADAIIVPSVLLQDLYINFHGVKESKIHLVPNPVPLKSDKTTQETTKNIIYASRLVAYKNLAFVIEVLAEILPQYTGVKFIIMGDGPERPYLEKLRDQLNLSNKVVFTGTLSEAEVKKYTSECLFGIAPALTEFNPNYILQCIAFNKPFLVSRENGFPFNIPEEFLFDSRNKLELEKRLLYLLKENTYKEAREKTENFNFKMSWEDVFNENIKVLKKL